MDASPAQVQSHRFRTHLATIVSSVELLLHYGATYPDSDRALSTKPVFAWTLPSAGVPFIRLEIVPSTPAIGSAS